MRCCLCQALQAEATVHHSSVLSTTKAHQTGTVLICKGACRVHTHSRSHSVGHQPFTLKPPSTAMHWPVMKDAAGEHRKATSPAAKACCFAAQPVTSSSGELAKLAPETSSGCAMRLMGVLATMEASLAWSFTMYVTKGVSCAGLCHCKPLPGLRVVRLVVAPCTCTATLVSTASCAQLQQQAPAAHQGLTLLTRMPLLAHSHARVFASCTKQLDQPQTAA